VNPEQALPAFIAALLAEGVEPSTIEQAASIVASIAPGRSVTGGDPLVRAFAFEQAKRMTR
jgi:hypothetical protein